MNPMRLMETIFGLVAVLSKDQVDILFNDIMNVLSHHGAGGQPGPAPKPTSTPAKDAGK